jgi:hypothetical protein
MMPVWLHISGHQKNKLLIPITKPFLAEGAFTPNVESVLSENLGGILGGTQY